MLVGRRLAPPAELIRGASLFLDFDGTLVDIAERPDAVIVSDRLRSAIRALDEAMPGRLAIVTGRPAAQVDGLLGLPRLSLSGSHGAEMMWADGRRRNVPRPVWLDATVARLETFSRERPGVLVEVKPFGVALHYRQAPEAERACLRFAESLAETSDIHLQRGKMVVELRVAGADKGAAILAFMEEGPMAETRPLVFGDDLTDEAAFVAARALGGAGVLVGPERESAARYRVDDVGETLAWMEAAARLLA